MTATATAESMRDRFARVTSELLDSDPRLAVVLAEIGLAGFVRARRRHPDRIINVGIREQLMISVASGLALSGMRPIAHSYTPFLVERPFEQVKLDLAHQGVGAILVSVGASYDASDSGRTHQAPEDVALVSSLPDWQIHVPGHPDEVELLLRDAVAGNGNVYIRLAGRANAEPMPIEPGRFQVVRRGSQAVVIAAGPMLDRTLEATADLDVTVLYATHGPPVRRGHAACRAVCAGGGPGRAVPAGHVGHVGQRGAARSRASTALDRRAAHGEPPLRHTGAARRGPLPRHREPAPPHR